jgi:hypothetical protein
MTSDEKAGIDWWNELLEWERGMWLRAAKTAVPAEAYAYYKQASQSTPNKGVSGS